MNRRYWLRKGLIGMVCVAGLSLTGCGSKAEQEVCIVDGQIETKLLVEEGTTVEQALTEAEIFIGKKDVVEPSRDSVISKDVKEISIERFAKISVSAEGKTKEFTFTGGKVSDAIESAEITLEEDDSVNHDLDAYLTNGMSIEVVHNDLSEDGTDGEENHSEKSKGNKGTDGDSERKIVSKEKIYDCDGSGHGYYSITWSDGSVEYEDF